MTLGLTLRMFKERSLIVHLHCLSAHFLKTKGCERRRYSSFTSCLHPPGMKGPPECCLAHASDCTKTHATQPHGNRGSSPTSRRRSFLRVFALLRSVLWVFAHVSLTFCRWVLAVVRRESGWIGMGEAEPRCSFSTF